MLARPGLRPPSRAAHQGRSIGKGRLPGGLHRRSMKIIQFSVRRMAYWAAKPATTRPTRPSRAKKTVPTLTGRLQQSGKIDCSPNGVTAVRPWGSAPPGLSKPMRRNRQWPALPTFPRRDRGCGRPAPAQSPRFKPTGWRTLVGDAPGRCQSAKDRGQPPFVGEPRSVRQKNGV